MIAMGMHMTGGNGILTVPSEHLPGLVALAVFPMVAWFALVAIRAGGARRIRPAVRLQRRTDATPSAGRVALMAMLLGAAVHAAIIPTHWGDSRGLAILFALDTLGFLAASAWLLLDGRHWRVAAFAMLAGTVVGYATYVLKGWETPDLVGLVTTGVELSAALVLVVPRRTRAAAPTAAGAVVTTAPPTTAPARQGPNTTAGIR